MIETAYENISSLLVFTVLFLIVYAAILNIYFIHKNGFHVGVNCWFCNKSSKVLYSKRNSFECPFCFQYNGFNKDGGYNKVIEAQHKRSLNPVGISLNKRLSHLTPKLSNGLCDLCNRNQELKVIQLANYEPLDERNYDKEIKHFEKQLEKTYGLCRTCSSVVKNTVRRQNGWIFGNRLKNLKSFKKPFLSKVSQSSSRFYHRLNFFPIILLVLSLSNLAILCGLDVFLPRHVLPHTLLPNIFTLFSDFYTSIYSFGISVFGSRSILMYLPKTLRLQKSSIFPISILGLCVELLYSFIESNCKLFSKVNKFLSWIILGLVSTFHFKHNIFLYFTTLEIFCSLYLIYAYGSVCVKNKQPQKFRLKRIKRDLKNEDYSENDESDSDSVNISSASFRTAINKHSPITAGSFSNLNNRSFESVRSKSTLNNTLINDDLLTAKNVELNRHFNDLNISAFDPNISKGYQSPASPNPFLNESNRPLSPNSMYNFGSTCNSPNNSFLNQPPHRSLFTPQSPRLNSSLNHIASSPFSVNQNSHPINHTRNVSPMSVRTEPLYTQNQSYNVASSFYDHGLSHRNQPPPTSFLPKNNSQHSNSFLLGDTSSVISQKGIIPRSPAYNLRPSARSCVLSPVPPRQEPLLNNAFRPLSPSSTLERPSRSLLLSPSKLNNINSFNSNGKENGSLSMSFYAEGAPGASMWSNINDSHVHQRFVVNSLSNIQCSSRLNNSFIRQNLDKNKLNKSRSSSTSSGFISNGEFAKGLSKSLPNSRENSPERSSLLSEPVYT